MGRRRSSSSAPDSPPIAKIAKDELENKAAERTAELVRANELLQGKIEEQKQAEIFLPESESNFRALADRSTTAIFIVQEEKFIYINANFTEGTGYTLEDLATVPFWNIIAPEMREQIKANAAARQQRGDSTPRHYELKVITKSGEKKIADVGVAGGLFNGRPAILGSVVDLTDRKRAEEALSESRGMLAHAQAMAHVGHWDRDLSTGKVRWSDETYRIYGLTPREEDMDMPSFLQVIHPEDRARVDKALGDAIDGVRPYETVFRVVRPDGSIRWVHGKGEVTFTSDGRPERIFGTVLDITERKQAEEALRQSEERFRSLVETTSDWVWEMDKDALYTYASPKITDLLGYDPEEVIGKSPFDLMPGDEAERVGALFSEIADSRRPFAGIDNVSLHKDGRRITLETSGVPILDNKGRLSGYRGIDRDISERKRAEQELQEAERKYRELVRYAPAGIYEIDPRTQRFTSVNDAMCQILGYSREELLLIDPQDLFDEESRSRFRDRMASLSRGGQPNAQAEHRIRTKDGRSIDVLVNVTFHNDEDGQPVGVTGIAYDITERKKMEEELRQSHGELERRVAERTAQLSRLATAMNYASEGVIIADTEWHIEYVNDAFTRLSGYTQGEVIGKEMRFLRPKKTDHAVYDSARASAQAGRPYIGRYSVRKKDGKEFYVESARSPVKDPDGNIINFVIVWRDVSEQLKLEEQLRQSQKMEAVGTLAGGIAHDFNNMLAVIIGNTELALDEIEDEGARGNLKQILNASMRSRDLVKQILAFSRKEGRKGKIIQAVPILEDTFNLLRSSLPTTINMKLNIRANRDVTVLAEPSQIQQVVMNLANNAAYAMRADGGELTIGLSTVTGPKSHDEGVGPRRYVKLTMKDTGEGITQEVQNRMFEPFFTTKEQGYGTGMGLAVVYGIVQNWGGTIEVESEIGKGSRFNILIPQAAVPPMMEEEEEEDIPCLGKESVLFIDDEPAIVEMTKAILEGMGCRVSAFTDPSDAIKAFTDRPAGFDLVITDQTMPKMTGVALAKEVLGVRKDMPIILCTGYSEMVTPEKAKEVGIREFVMKPITKREIAQTIKRVIGEEKDSE
jgi:PAS domain S-box-containing protein